MTARAGQGDIVPRMAQRDSRALWSKMRRRGHPPREHRPHRDVSLLRHALRDPSAQV